MINRSISNQTSAGITASLNSSNSQLICSPYAERDGKINRLKVRITDLLNDRKQALESKFQETDAFVVDIDADTENLRIKKRKLENEQDSEMGLI
jgi:hypothetical protein